MNGNRRGPENKGPQTGRGLGYCSGNSKPGCEMNNQQFNNKECSIGIGQGFGHGTGFGRRVRRRVGRGMGLGYGRRKEDEIR